MVPRGLSQGGALSKAGERVHPGLRGEPRTAGDAANTCSLITGEHKWSHVHRNGEEEQRGSFSEHT